MRGEAEDGMRGASVGRNNKKQASTGICKRRRRRDLEINAASCVGTREAVLKKANKAVSAPTSHMWLEQERRTGYVASV